LRWTTTVAVVAAVRGVALPELAFEVVTPALDGRVVLRSGATHVPAQMHVSRPRAASGHCLPSASGHCLPSASGHCLPCCWPLPPLHLTRVYQLAIVSLANRHIILSNPYPSSLTSTVPPPPHCLPSRANCRSHQPGPSSGVLPQSSYQQRARQNVACGDRDSRPPSPQIDRRKVLPHLCVRAARSATNPTSPLNRHNRRGGRAGQPPLLSSPRCDVSPCPSCPYPLEPQHLTVASSCNELQFTIPHTSMSPARTLLLLAAPPPHSREPNWHLVSRLSPYHPLQPLKSYLHGPSTPSHCPLPTPQSKLPLKPPGPSLRVLPPASYQQRAHVILASSDRESRPPSPQIDHRKVLPHLCVRAARSATNPTPPLYRHKRRGCRAGKSPLLSSPRPDVSPCPSCP